MLFLLFLILKKKLKMSKDEKYALWLISFFLIVGLVCLLSSCSVLAVTAGKAKSSITQTTTTTTVVDSVSVSPHIK